MKRKFTLLMLLLFAFLVGANFNTLKAQDIDVNKTYRIKVDASTNEVAVGQYLTNVEGTLTFQSLNEGDPDQQFTFEATGNTDQYYIKFADSYVYWTGKDAPAELSTGKIAVTVQKQGTGYTIQSSYGYLLASKAAVYFPIFLYTNGSKPFSYALWTLEAVDNGDEPEPGNSNSIVTIGSGNSTDNTMPTRPSSVNSATQQIYTASEINHAAGAITKIAFKGENLYGYSVTRNWEVYLANTDKTAFASTSDWVTSGFVKVFDGQVTLPSSAGWFELSFTNNFDYTGNNIALCVIDKTGNSGDGVKFYICDGSSLSVRGSGPYDINSLPNASSQYSFKNQIQLTFSDGKQPGVPQNLKVTSVTHESVALAWDEAENADKYIVYNKDGVKVGETENTSYVVTDLNPLTDYTFTVTAVHESEESAQSGAVTATTTSAVSTRDIVFELQDSYGDGWTGNYIEVYYNDEIDPRYTLQNENLDGQNNNTSGGEMQSKTLSIPEGTKVRVEYIVHVLSGNWSSPDENNIKIYYKDGSCINGKSSAEANGNEKNGNSFQVVEFVVGENTACLTAPYNLYIVSGDNVLYPEETIQIKWTEPNADVLSYNVYCNDVLIGNVTDASYDLTVDKFDVSYNNIAVSAVYAEGESAKSDPLQIQVPRYFELTINVTNNGNPVADATVVLSGGKDDMGNYPAPRTFTTDANGQVIANVLSIRNNASDTYKITVTKAMFDTGYDEFGWYETQFSNVTRNIVLEMEGPKNVVATPSNLFVGESTTITWDAVASGSATYNVYVDGVKHNTQPITTNRYTISDLSYNANPGHVVAVTAVYAAGETSKSTVDVKVAGTFTLTVNVTNDQGMPIQGATVSLETDEWTEDELGNKIASYGTKTTDANGQAVYQNVKLLKDASQGFSGYTVYVSKGLFGSSFQTVDNSNMTITNGENVNRYFSLSLPVPENVDTDADSYEADDDAVLTWAAPQGFAAEVLGYNIYKVEYDGGGSSQTKLNDALVTELTYTVEDVEAGQYYLGVSAVYAEGESKATTCYISVVGRGRLVGTVVNAQSDPINGADIVVHGYDVSGNPVRFEGIKTNANGRFVIEPIPASNNDGYTIEAKALGYYDYVSDANNNAHVTLDGETKVTVMMRSEPFVDIEVTAVDRDTYADVRWDWPMTGGLVTKSADLVRLDVASGVTTNLATDLNAQDYQDNDWNSLPNGEYQYGVTLLIEEEKQHFYEDFETIEGIVLKGEDPNKWSRYELNTNGTLADSEKGRWNIVKSEPGVFTAPDEGSAACSPNPSTDNYPTRYIMVSPLIDLREAYLPQLSFSYYTPKDSNGTANGLKVLVMTESQGKMGAAEAEQLWYNDEKYTEGFVNQVVDLNYYVGEKIYLVFDTKLNWMKTYVDLIEVKSQKEEWKSRITWSNSLVKGAVVFTGTGNWNDAARWSSGAVPAKTDDAVIKGQATINDSVEINSVNVARNESAVGGMIGGDEDYSLTLEPTAVLKVTKGIANSGSASALLIKDGAQLYQNATDVDATFVMNIVNPTTWETDHKRGWQIIASPLKEASTNSFKPADSDYDLYKYDGTQELQWVNHKFHTTHNPSLLYDFEDNQLPEGFDRPQLTTTHTQWELSSVTPQGSIEILRSNIGSEYCLYSETLRDDSNPDNLEIDNWMVLPEQRIVNGTYLQFETACYFSPSTMLGQYGGQYIDERLEILVSENVYDSEDDFVSVYDIEVDNGVQGGNTAGSWETYQVDLSAYAEKNVYIAFRHTKMTNANVSQAVFVDDIRLINENFSMFEESFVQGRGYMASYETETTATFTGELSHESEFFFKDVKGYNSSDRYENFYLLGNPFTFNMNWSQVGYDGIVEGYATVDADGSYQYFKDGEIKVGDGFFVQTIQNDPYVEYTSTRRRMNDKYINIIAKGKNGDENLIIDFSGSEKEGFNKLENFNDEIAELYILDEGYRYAIKNFDDDTEEVDFRFDAKHLGNYTISALTEGEFETVILVDKTTGIETNLLVEDYTFTSTADEAKDRFIIKLVNGQQPTENGQFAYQSGGELIINAQGTVQIVDVLGRVVYQNEHSNDINRINVENLERASYVVRCVNGNEVKTQRIVVL